MSMVAPARPPLVHARARRSRLAPLLLALAGAWGCADEVPTQQRALGPDARAGVSADLAPVDESQARVVVDAAQPLGPVMRIAQASTHSTSSPLPGEPTRVYMQGLEHEVVRTWIQTRYVYNKGNIDYNYKYETSNVGAEDALRFYATTGKSILIALSAYNPTSIWPVPQGQAFVDFLTTTLVYYKSKYPNVRYIQVGNEPDANDETMETYYPIYRQYYQAVNAANAQLGLTGADRILISNGPFTSNVPNMIAYARPFFAAYQADTDPAKRLDFFSFHGYGETNRPAELLTARERIHAAMAEYGIPRIPLFVSEYGVFGGSTLPTGMTRAQLVTMQPAGQLTKAFYLYEGGIDAVFNWAIHHSSLQMKSQLANVQTAIPYPYGHAMTFAKRVSDLGTRLRASSKLIDAAGLGTHVLASASTGKGVAVLVWNFNWRNAAIPTDFNVLVKNLPLTMLGGGKVRSTTYMLDSKTNNYFTNPAQTTLTATRTEELDYAPALAIPMSMEQHSVALIVLEPAGVQARIDVQPASISLTKSSQVSVYLYGSASLDVATVDAATVRLHPNGTGAGAAVMQRTPGAYFTTVRDYDGDGRADRLLVFSVADLKAAGLGASTTGLALRGPGMSGVDAAPPTIVP
jgi:hypothetical protein